MAQPHSSLSFSRAALTAGGVYPSRTLREVSTLTQQQRDALGTLLAMFLNTFISTGTDILVFICLTLVLFFQLVLNSEHI